jgi:hypothetical protein
VTDREWPDVRGGDGPRGFSVRPSVQAGEVIVGVVGELDLATAPVLDEVCRVLALWRAAVWWSMFHI